MSMNSGKIRISNRVPKTKVEPLPVKQKSKNIPELFKEVRQAFDEVDLSELDGLLLDVTEEEKSIKITITIKRWNYPILMTIESIVFIYILLLTSGIPVVFDFMIVKELQNIGSSLSSCFDKIKVDLKFVRDSEDLKNTIMESFELLYAPFKTMEKVNTLYVGIDKKYLQKDEKPVKIKINKRRKKS